MKIILPLLLLGLSSYAYSKEPAKIFWAINEGLTHQITIAKQFAKEMKKHNVNIEITLFPESDEQFNEPMDGKTSFDITQNVSYRFYDKSPNLRVWEIPFLFRTPEIIEKYIQSQSAKRSLEKLETKYERALTFTFAGGFLNFLTPKKVNSFNDFKGLSCIFDDTHLFFNHFLSGLDISNQSEEFKDYSSICREELTAEIDINSIKHTNYFTFTKHRVIARVLRVSKKALNNLKDKKEIFITQLLKFTDKERELVYAEDQKVIDTLKSRGLDFAKWSDKNKDSQFKDLFEKKVDSLDKSLLDEIKYIKSLY